MKTSHELLHKKPAKLDKYHTPYWGHSHPFYFIGLCFSSCPIGFAPTRYSSSSRMLAGKTSNSRKSLLMLWFHHESIKFYHFATPICALQSPSTEYFHPGEWTFTGCCLEFPTQSGCCYRNSLPHLFANFYPPYLCKVLPQGRSCSWWFRKWSGTY
jgi:hypothetical protein